VFPRWICRGRNRRNENIEHKEVALMELKWILAGLLGLMLVCVMIFGFDNAKIIAAILIVLFLFTKGMEYLKPILDKTPYDIK
jgi:hypothetical protein